ncbi:MAG TPA: hypothetical protein VH817_15010 [Thermoleophilaceae bacterium]|jgi:hypothetical protein
MATGIGLILIGFALFALSRPYMEMTAGSDPPTPVPKREPWLRRVAHVGKRSGAHLRLGFGQLLGLAAIAFGIVLLLR